LLQGSAAFSWLAPALPAAAKKSASGNAAEIPSAKIEAVLWSLHGNNISLILHARLYGGIPSLAMQFHMVNIASPIFITFLV
jgi:hypothetical protein